MRNDYEEYVVNSNFRKDSTDWKSKGYDVLGKLAFNAVRGLADWIGLGDTFASWFDSKDANWPGIRSKLTARINKLLEQNEIDLSKLQQKMDELASMGYALTGIARQRITESATKLKKEYDNKVKQNANDKLNLTRMQNDADKIKTLGEGADPISYSYNKDIAQKLEESLGDYENGKI